MAIYEEHTLAYAKINLFLRVCGQRPDGYHLLSTLMQSISLCDEITVTCSDRAGQDGFAPGISLSTNAAFLPNNAKNTAYRAARAFLDALGQKDISVKIHIQKNIPSQAGLGGGSTDAAAVLKALAKIFPDNVQKDALFEMAREIGADVPFCMDGGTQLCEGIGDVLSPVAALRGLPILLIKPTCGISTPRAFARYDEMKELLPQDPQRDVALERLIRSPQNSDPFARISDAAPYLYNDLEMVAEYEFPVLAEIRTFLKKEGAIVARMSGSGSAIFGIFENAQKRDMARQHAGKYCGAQVMLYSGETK